MRFCAYVSRSTLRQLQSNCFLVSLAAGPVELMVDPNLKQSRKFDWEINILLILTVDLTSSRTKFDNKFLGVLARRQKVVNLTLDAVQNTQNWQNWIFVRSLPPAFESNLSASHLKSANFAIQF